MRTLPSSWERKLDDWNRGHSNHPPIVIRWEPCAVKRLKLVNVYGVKIKRWGYEPRWQVGVVLLSRPPGMESLAQYIEGSGGQWFIKLFSWQTAQGEFVDLDDRIFRLLELGDMTRRDVVRDVERVEAIREERGVAERAERARAGADYYHGYDNPVVPVNPEVASTGGWRWRTR